MQRRSRGQRKSVLQLDMWTSCRYHVLAQGSFKLPTPPPPPKKKKLMSRIDYSPPVIWISSKNLTCSLGNSRTEFTSLIAKCTSPGLSDVTFFARWRGFHMVNVFVILCTCEAKTNDWCKFWSKLSQLTNHGVYWELVYILEPGTAYPVWCSSPTIMSSLFMAD